MTQGQYKSIQVAFIRSLETIPFLMAVAQSFEASSRSRLEAKRSAARIHLDANSSFHIEMVRRGNEYSLPNRHATTVLFCVSRVTLFLSPMWCPCGEGYAAKPCGGSHEEEESQQSKPLVICIS